MQRGEVSLGYDVLVSALASMFVNSGYSRGAAETTARHLVDAERVGRRSHGIRLAVPYLEEARAGETDGTAQPVVLERAPSRLVVDANMAPGHHALRCAMAEAMGVAAETGTCLLWLTNLRHVGALRSYLDMLAAERMSGIVTVTSAGDDSLALVAPPGGSTRSLGSNPIGICICEGDEVILTYDGALAATTYYEIARTVAEGVPLAAAAIVGPDGKPSDSPEDFAAGGAILPLGGGRGFGLSLALALFSQLGAGPPTAGCASAFSVIVATGRGRLGLSKTVDRVRAAGGHIPGDAGPAPRRHLSVDRRDLAELEQLGLDLRR